eukprot:s6067_g1.t1
MEERRFTQPMKYFLNDAWSALCMQAACYYLASDYRRGALKLVMPGDPESTKAGSGEAEDAEEPPESVSLEAVPHPTLVLGAEDLFELDQMDDDFEMPMASQKGPSLGEAAPAPADEQPGPRTKAAMKRKMSSSGDLSTPPVSKKIPAADCPSDPMQKAINPGRGRGRGQTKTTAEPQSEKHTADEPQKDKHAADEPQKEKHAADEPQKEKHAADEAQKEKHAVDEAQKEKHAADEPQKEADEEGPRPKAKPKAKAKAKAKTAESADSMQRRQAQADSNVIVIRSHAEAHKDLQPPVGFTGK